MSPESVAGLLKNGADPISTFEVSLIMSPESVAGLLKNGADPISTCEVS